MSDSHAQKIVAAYAESSANFIKLQESAGQLAAISERCAAALDEGRHLFFCGNGGSAADAQHIAAELVGRFMKERRPLPATALTTNTSTITAIGNDYGYDDVFSRQLEGLAKTGDIFFGFSTSGNSKNVVKAIESARKMGVYTIGVTGAGGGKMAAMCDECLKVPSHSTPRIQEMHIAIGHMLCATIDDIMFP